MSSPSATRPKAIDAVPLRHPWRTTSAIVLILFLVLFVLDSATRPAFGWSDFAKYVFDQRISAAAFVTLQLTVYSMVIAIVLALILSVMRLSPNPVLNSVSWFYIWVFRGTPLYVQLVFWGLLAVIYPTINIGIPFMDPWVSIPTTQAVSLFWLSVVGLGLNEASYLSEIMRAGIQSVDHGQTEAATALGMSWAKQMRLIVLPQAMRVIIPPTGNELIGMMKSTSLVVAVPFSWDLYTRSRDVGIEIFNPVPLLMVSCAWYLLMTSILMVGQHFLEKRFARGTTLIGGTK
ncbi:MAG: amino acid ABC transporter permease [Leucobacter sp.]